MASKPDDLAGTQRAAILLMSLGEQDAANVLKQLDAREVQKLGIAMAELKEVSREQMSSVLNNFIGVADAKANIAGGSQDYVRRVLTQAVGKHKTDMLMDRVSSGQTGQGIEALKWMESKAVAQIIGGEHPQIAAIVLAHLEPDQSAAILPLLSDELRTEVLMRIASLNEVPQTALTELDQLVERQANVAPPAPLRRVGGARTVANILNAMERDKSGEELGKIEKTDGEMHQKIKELLFVFDNLMDVDDRGIQALLREVGSDTLAVALRGAEPEVQEKILKNMSKRAAEILKDDMEVRGPVKLTDVEAAQKEIIVITQRMAEEGTITLGGKGGGKGGGEFV
ncbi:MAG TPA: flagellar motor switch protein FliG [Steroidobacteraceae bacterium]|jgi:flagellar motor switch protein FliG|nr:flagellar motor switch protein FliG [Steroidobacteraceae bacterium]